MDGIAAMSTMLRVLLQPSSRLGHPEQVAVVVDIREVAGFRRDWPRPL